MRPAHAFPTLALILILVLAPSALAQGNFKVAGPSGLRHASQIKDPLDLPPFCHWDLRVWDGCTVPFKVMAQSPGVLAGDDTVQIDGTILSGPNGICETAASVGDVQVIPVGNGEPNHVCVGPGADGLGDTFPEGDDGLITGGVTTGPNGVCETTPPAFDDVQTIPRGQGEPHTVCVTGGNTPPNTGLEEAALTQGVLAWNDVVPALHQWSADGTSNNGEASDGVNVLDFADPATRPEMGNDVLGLTYITCNTLSGIITDADVLFNETKSWSLGKSGGVCQGGPHPGVDCRNHAVCGAGGVCGDLFEDLLSIATHEAGHMLGLHHSTRSGATMVEAVGFDLSWRTLEEDDHDGKNYLYTPDLGDAPDPSFPSLVHGTTVPDDGAVHLFGWRRPMKSFLYEWLGDTVDDNPMECEALVVDQDPFDDGVEFGPRTAIRGFPLKIRVTVSSAGPASRYANFPMYLNGWLDLNGNGTWEDAERLVQDAYFTADRRIYEVFIPDTVPDEFWTRFRLDWAENVTSPAPDPTLDRERGAAQFGEVEDYRVPVKDLTLSPGEPSNPKHPLHFPHDAWIDPATGDMIVNYAAACDAIDHTIYWGTLAPGGDFSTYTGQACLLGAEGVATFNPGPDSVFWVIVANDGEVEGSYGTDSNGFERDPAGAADPDRCAYPQVIGAECDYLFGSGF